MARIDFTLYQMILQKAGLVKWWEHSPSTNMAWGKGGEWVIFSLLWKIQVVGIFKNTRVYFPLTWSGILAS